MNKSRLIFFGILLTLFLLVGGQIQPHPITAQSTGRAILVEPAEQQGSACAGSSVTYFIKITNNTETVQAFYLEYESDWNVTGVTSTPTIEIGSYLDIPVAVDVPVTALRGTYEALTITVSDASHSESATATAVTTSSFCSGYLDLASVPTGREVRFPSVVFWEGKLYKIGGYGDVGGSSAATAWLDIYDIATNSWSSGPDMPGARYWMDCEAIKDKIYCAGGYLNTSQSSFYIYDIDAGTWSTGPDLPAARYNYASAKINSKYYVMGGYGGGYLSSILVYDPNDGVWDDTKAPMNTARRHFQAGMIDGYIYVAGGFNGSYLSTAEIYNPVDDVWKDAAAMPQPVLNAADAVLHNRWLLLLGGSGAGTTSGSIKAFAYDALEDHWFVLPDLDHLLYGAEGDGDGNQMWTATGRLYEGGTFIFSPYTFKLQFCPKFYLDFLPLLLK